jgi:hypothetical protein
MADKTIISIEVEGLDDIITALDGLELQIYDRFVKGFQRYAKMHLVPRIKQRLTSATDGKRDSKMDAKGNFIGGGGYEVPQNKAEYSAWKKSRSNLPLVGSISPRALVATGHLVESIDLQKFSGSIESVMFEVGANNNQRPSAIPFSSVDGQAKFGDLISNKQLLTWIEDSKYAFMAKEAEDVRRDVLELAKYLIVDTIVTMLQEYANKKTKSKL